MAITIDARVSGYNDSPIRIVGVCLPQTGQILLKKILPFNSKVEPDSHAIVVTDSPSFVENWQLAFREKDHLEDAIKTYLMRQKNGLVRLEKEVERFNPATVIAIRKVDKGGSVQELNSDSLQNGHIAVLLAVWASAKANAASVNMNPPKNTAASGLLMPTTLNAPTAISGSGFNRFLGF